MLLRMLHAIGGSPLAARRDRADHRHGGASYQSWRERRAALRAYARDETPGEAPGEALGDVGAPEPDCWTDDERGDDGVQARDARA